MSETPTTPTIDPTNDQLQNNKLEISETEHFNAWEKEFPKESQIAAQDTYTIMQGYEKSEIDEHFNKWETQIAEPTVERWNLESDETPNVSLWNKEEYQTPAMAHQRLETLKAPRTRTEEVEMMLHSYNDMQLLERFDALTKTIGGMQSLV